jgi:UDPglucose 6-dehydrogenase
MKRTISVIGQGFVGGSLTTVFSEKGFNVIVYDKAGKAAPGANDYRPSSLSDLVKFTESQEGFSGIYFACLPTPMFEDGSADLSIVEGVLDELSTIPGERIVVIKSTIPPGSTEKWNEKYSSTGLRIIFNPEFLTERTALEDMRNQSRIILGGPRPWINSVKQIFRIAFNDVPIIKTSSTTAEMIKYLTNNFLTVKVAFANEMAQICEALDASGLNIDYDKVVEYASYDERVGKSHWNVPGPDGKRGYGGHCFPKDINAMIDVACKNGVDPKILKAAWQKNLEIRPEKDWESLTGRAVSAKSKT